MSKVYCLGENTGCGHEDKPTLRECSDCPYMTTIKPMSEQDELLLTEIKEILIKPLKISYQQYADEAIVQGAINQAGEILAKAKQHYEQKIQTIFEELNKHCSHTFTSKHTTYRRDCHLCMMMIKKQAMEELK